SLTSRSASRRSVFTRSLAARGISPGAHTKQSIPAACNLRANTNPVGPASYVARTDPASPAANAATSSLEPGSRRTPKLTRVAVQHRRHDAADVHIEGHPGLSLSHVGTPMIAVGAHANPEPSTRAPHARGPP